MYSCHIEVAINLKSTEVYLDVQIRPFVHVKEKCPNSCNTLKRMIRTSKLIFFYSKFGHVVKIHVTNIYLNFKSAMHKKIKPCINISLIFRWFFCSPHNTIQIIYYGSCFCRIIVFFITMWRCDYCQNKLIHVISYHTSW